MDQIYSLNNRATVIKSQISNDKKTAFICYTVYSSGAICLQYNIDNNQFTEEIKYINSCKGTVTTMNLYYFREKNSLMVICQENGQHNKLTSQTFNSQFEAIGSSKIYQYGEHYCNFDTFNIFYLPYANDLIIISDISYNGQTFTSGINLSIIREFNINTLKNMKIFVFKNPDEDNEVTDSLTEKITDTITDKITDTITDKITDKVTDKKDEEGKKVNEIVQQSSTKTKEEMIYDLDNLVKDKDPTEAYLISGDSYTVIKLINMSKNLRLTYISPNVKKY